MTNLSLAYQCRYRRAVHTIRSIIVAFSPVVHGPSLAIECYDDRLDPDSFTDSFTILLRFFYDSFIYGLATYAVLYIIYNFLGNKFSILQIDGQNQKVLLIGNFVDEILWSLPVSILLAIFWIAATNHKWLTRFLQWIRVTKRYGDEDVWDFTFNSSQAAVEYVHVRDFDKGIVYAGWVNTFSETGKLRELVLRDVIIYDSAGNMKFEVPLLYISRDPRNIDVEFPYK